MRSEIKKSNREGAGMSRFRVGDSFVLGVNYWPRQSAMAMWTESGFDRVEIAEDFDLLRRLFGPGGIVRVFLKWEDFQPSMRGGVERKQLDMLKYVADLAVEKELLLDVTFFTGHMSGPNWIPE